MEIFYEVVKAPRVDRRGGRAAWPKGRRGLTAVTRGCLSVSFPADYLPVVVGTRDRADAYGDFCGRVVGVYRRPAGTAGAFKVAADAPPGVGGHRDQPGHVGETIGGAGVFAAAGDGNDLGAEHDAEAAHTQDDSAWL